MSSAQENSNWCHVYVNMLNGKYIAREKNVCGSSFSFTRVKKMEFLFIFAYLMMMYYEGEEKFFLTGRMEMIRKEWCVQRILKENGMVKELSMEIKSFDGVFLDEILWIFNEEQ